MILYTVLRMSALTVVGWMARDDDDDDSNDKKQTRTDHDATVHAALYCLGQCLNAATGKVLKSVIAQERPRKMCLALRTCGEYGMPSSHSMVWAFFWVSTLVFDRSGLAGPSWVEGRRGDLGLVVGVVVVPVLRVVSGHHTIGQVTVGLVLGGLLGALWRSVVDAMGSPKFVERVQVKMIDTPPVRLLDEEELRRRQEVIIAYKKGMVSQSQSQSQSKAHSGTTQSGNASGRNGRTRKADREAAELAAANIARELLGDEGSSEEDTSDEAYEERHQKHEDEERVRYNAFMETLTSANGGRKTVGDGRGRSMMGMQAKAGDDANDANGANGAKPTTSSRKRASSRTSSDASGAGGVDLKTPAAGLRKQRR